MGILWLKSTCITLTDFLGANIIIGHTVDSCSLEDYRLQSTLCLYKKVIISDFIIFMQYDY